ncbi:MAG: Crp/Fnr family transcriptional regulator [Thermotogae bacterium]|nr:Crp/Fnr family transcriptional regulator [Thermotogota bacterium]
MKEIHLSSRTLLYGYGQRLTKVFFLAKGQLRVEIAGKVFHKSSGSVGEWALFQMSSCEIVTAETDVVLHMVEVRELFEHADALTILDMLKSLEERLKTADGALQEILEDLLHTQPREACHQTSVEPRFRLVSPIFEDYVRMKRLFFEKNYDEALELAQNYARESLPEDLKSEFVVWRFICEAAKDPDRLERLSKRLKAQIDPGIELTSRRYFDFLAHGGELDPVLEVFVKAGYHLPAGTLVIKEGEEANMLFITLRGYLKTFRRCEDEVEFFLSFIRPGELFGEAAITGHKRAASVCSITPVDVIALKPERLDKEIEDYPTFGFSILEGELRRIQNTVQLVKIFSNDNPIKRAEAFIRLFSDVLEKAQLNVSNLAEILFSEKVGLINTLRSLGFGVGSDGTIKASRNG